MHPYLLVDIRVYYQLIELLRLSQLTSHPTVGMTSIIRMSSRVKLDHIRRAPAMLGGGESIAIMAWSFNTLWHAELAVRISIKQIVEEVRYTLTRYVLTPCDCITTDLLASDIIDQ
jgi:hypothetical protein